MYVHILRFIAFVKCTYLLIILSNFYFHSIFLHFFFYKNLKILYNFIQQQQYNFEWRQTVILYWCWIKKYFSQKIFWLLIPFNVWLSCHFYNLLFAYFKSFFLKRRKQVISWNCFFVKRFPDTFLNDFAFVSSLFLFLYWTQLVNTK